MGIDFEPTGSSELYVTNSVINYNGFTGNGGGIFVAAASGGTAKASISGLTVVNSSGGIRVDGGSTTNPTAVSIENTVSAGNTHNGIVAQTTSGPVTVTIDRSVFNTNNVGVHVTGSGGTIYLGNSVVTGNVTGVQAANSGQLFSYKNNEINGNGTDGTPLTAVSGGLN